MEVLCLCAASFGKRLRRCEEAESPFTPILNPPQPYQEMIVFSELTPIDYYHLMLCMTEEDSCPSHQIQW